MQAICTRWRTPCYRAARVTPVTVPQGAGFRAGGCIGAERWRGYSTAAVGLSFRDPPA